MVKIKTKKKMTLPELIQWGRDNGIVKEKFYGSLRGCVHFSDYGWIGIDEWGLVKPDDNFEVEIEEEITEETEIPVLIKMFEVSKIPRTRTSINSSIKEELEIVEKFGFNDPKAFYMLNSDSTATLLWKDGEMVE
ncbi:hypothetical protein MTQ89_08330 [Staphylococcus hyicus]|uniref:hypothetical protein n=1 Tax=Staphylococcus hyicus TaxID=1284 RepID=UPI00208F3F03|nr:hypothetical protein [Staphylococcus hyicus]MCO4330326.1 hypothetical protein [Staphylococcus hyicus]MCO4335835.1 hypothetical protein [Staphylococcus hyicus]MCO4336744.1 hypothetical protein [Staphylococcus hyicus]